MESWPLFRAAGAGRARGRPKTARGRRRQHLAAGREDPDAVLTDRDAYAAAQAVRASRCVPGRPAWELYGSQPVTRRRGDPDASDAVRTAGQAELAGTEAVRGTAAPAAVRRRPRDYGTGPAYNPAAMR